jgi:hypothetical protein
MCVKYNLVKRNKFGGLEKYRNKLNVANGSNITNAPNELTWR